MVTCRVRTTLENGGFQPWKKPCRTFYTASQRVGLRESGIVAMIPLF